VTFAGVAGTSDVARYECREHAREQWTWARGDDRWTRIDA
jgi:hypothetical protein